MSVPARNAAILGAGLVAGSLGYGLLLYFATVARIDWLIAIRTFRGGGMRNHVPIALVAIVGICALLFLLYLQPSDSQL